MEVREALLSRVEQYLLATGLTGHRLGMLAAGNPKIVSRLKSGKGVSLTSIERLEAFIRSHPPAKKDKAA